MLLKVRSYDFAREFAVCAAKILGKIDSYWVRRVVDKHGRWYLVKVTSFVLYEFVNKPLEELISYVVSFPKGFLRGFFTAEGNPSVSIQRARGFYLDVGVVVSNSDRKLLELARNSMLDSGYHPGKIRININEGEQTNLAIARKSGLMFNLSRVTEVRRFAVEIGFADSEKQTKLMEALAMVEKYGRARAAREWLLHYTKKGKKWMKNDGKFIV